MMPTFLYFGFHYLGLWDASTPAGKKNKQKLESIIENKTYRMRTLPIYWSKRAHCGEGVIPRNRKGFRGNFRSERTNVYSLGQRPEKEINRGHHKQWIVLWWQKDNEFSPAWNCKTKLGCQNKGLYFYVFSPPPLPPTTFFLWQTGAINKKNRKRDFIKFKN